MKQIGLAISSFFKFLTGERDPDSQMKRSFIAKQKRLSVAVNAAEQFILLTSQIETGVDVEDNKRRRDKQQRIFFKNN